MMSRFEAMKTKTASQVALITIACASMVACAIALRVAEDIDAEQDKAIAACAVPYRRAK